MFIPNPLRFHKKTESAKVRHSGRQKFVKTGTGKNKGFPEHCEMVRKKNAKKSKFKTGLFHFHNIKKSRLM